MDPDKNVRGDQFEKNFVPWFLKTDPKWKSLIDQDKIWLWDDYPKRWGRDCGIDLVFQDKNGKHWAVQSKCFHPDNSIPKNEINKFFAESNDKRIHGRVLIATTDRISDNAKQMIERQEKQVVCFLLDNFRKSEVVFPASLKDLNKGKRKDPRTPRKHQDQAIRDVVSGLRKARMGQLIMACGTGKTLTSLWIKEELKAQQVLVLVPSLSLLSQTLREWTATAKTQFKWLCVCSDESVAKQDRTEDSWFTHVADIGVPVTGDVKEIKSFLRSDGAKVVFSTYQSSPLIAEAQRDRKIPAFDIAFADEAHRCAGNVSEAFGCVLDSKRIRSNKVLFMTATPRILSKQTKSKTEGQDTEIVSMDDPQVFGEVLHQLKFSEAIDQDLLSDYRVVIVGVNHPTVRSRIQNRKLLRTSNGVKLDAETLATHVALAKAVKDYNLHRVISFHSRVAGAKDFAQDHTEVLEWMLPKDRPSGTTITDFVSGDMNSGDRNTKINRLRHLGEGERGILSNARCLSEGVDVPSLDGVAFIDPRKSQVDIVQAVGRAIRKSDGKTHGTILIPVFIEDHEDETEALESSRFKPIWDVVNALRSHDDDLAHELDSLRTELGKRKSIGASSRGLEKIVFDLPEMCEQSFVDGLRTRLVEQTTASWMFWYGLLQEYVEEYGDSPTADYKTKSDFRLGRWVTKQRSQQDSLTLERKRLLESLPGWSWDIWGDKWNERFQFLKAFVAKTGITKIPRTFKDNDSSSLESWVQVQRINQDLLTPERKRLLELLPGWSWDPYGDQWNEGFAQLKAYVEKSGNARPPTDHRGEDGFRIGLWFITQRRNKDLLTPERKRLLEGLPGWTWNAWIDQQWTNGFKHLKAHVKKTGKARPPKDHQDDDGFRLGEWVGNKRINKDSLTLERKRLLELLPGWSWDTRGDKWNEGLTQLKAYLKQTGVARPPHDHQAKDGYKLGRWVTKQRSRQDSLTPERKRLLELLPGWSWDTRGDQWNEGLTQLKAYVKQTGVARPPHDHQAKDGYKLGQWVGSQRVKKKTLTPNQIALLESLKGWSWDRFSDQWNEGFAQLKIYVKKNGEARPSNDYQTKNGFQLGAWIRNQRSRPDLVTAERKRFLESLEGWSWNPFFSDQWNKAFLQLQKYVKKTGKARPPKNHQDENGFRLGEWVCRQRQTRETLKPEQIEILNSLTGWSWDLLADQWNEAFEKLKEFAVEFGGANPLQNFKTKDGFALGTWVQIQRSYRELLTLERKRLLDSLTGWSFDPLADQWNKAFAQLKAYVKETGIARPPHDHQAKDGYKLGQWVSVQRGNKNKLAKERKRLLESLPGWVWVTNPKKK